MFSDYCIFLVAFIFLLMAVDLAYLRCSLLLARKQFVSVETPQETCQRIETFLRGGKKGDLLDIRRHNPAAAILSKTGLTLKKSALPDGKIGLEASLDLVREYRRLSSFAEKTPVDRRSEFETLLKELGLAWSEHTSPHGAHYSETYHYVQIDIGQNAELALKLADFLFTRVLDLPPGPIGYWIPQSEYLRRKCERFLTKIRRKFAINPLPQYMTLSPTTQFLESIRAEYDTLPPVVVQALGIAGLAYSLAFERPGWPTANIGGAGIEIRAPIFGLVWMVFFLLGAVSETPPDGSKAPIVSKPLVLLCAPLLMISAIMTILVQGIEVILLSLLSLVTRRSEFFVRLAVKKMPSKTFMEIVGISGNVLGALLCVAALAVWAL